jgi:hypothetical protein
MGRARSRQFHLAALVLLLPALLSRALIPAGFMPAADPHGVLALQMCSTGTFGVMKLPRVDRDSLLRAFDPGEQTPLGHGDRPAPCDFALASSGAAPPPAPVTAILATLPREPRPQPLGDRQPPVAERFEHPQQPRAPPHYS